MSTEIDPYAVLAKYYDGAYAAMTDLIDVPFYVDLANRIGGPVLETGCGTGRVLLPIALAGITIHGLDSSLAMLTILRQKINREPPDVRERIRSRSGHSAKEGRGRHCDAASGRQEQLQHKDGKPTIGLYHSRTLKWFY